MAYRRKYLRRKCLSVIIPARKGPKRYKKGGRYWRQWLESRFLAAGLGRQGLGRQSFFGVSDFGCRVLGSRVTGTRDHCRAYVWVDLAPSKKSELFFCSP